MDIVRVGACDIARPINWTALAVAAFIFFFIFIVALLVARPLICMKNGVNAMGSHGPSESVECDWCRIFLLGLLALILFFIVAIPMSAFLAGVVC